MALQMKTELAVAMATIGRRSIGNPSYKWISGTRRCSARRPIQHQIRHSLGSSWHSYITRSMVTHTTDIGGSSLSSFSEGAEFRSIENTEGNHPAPHSTPVKVSMDELLALASCHPTPLSLADMYRYGDKPLASSKRGNEQFVDIVRLRNAQFLHRELPIRIAQRAIDLLTLPHGLNRTREVQSIANTYLKYLQSLRDIPCPTNVKSENEFTNALKNFILDRHSIPMAISRGLQSLNDERKAPVDDRRLAEMEEALSRFFTARVGLRFLVEHHVLTGNDENSDDLYKQQLELEGGLELLSDDTITSKTLASSDSRGCIQQNCDPIKEVKRTVARVTKLCRESYGIVPDIQIVNCTVENSDVPFTYVPHHLRYMLAELLKNSCRATVKSYLSGGNSQKEDHTKYNTDPDGGIHDSPSLPPIKIVITKGREDVTIKVADQGGGMPRSVSKHIWSFSHSTLSKEVLTREDQHDFGKDDFTGGHIRGFGLPLARIYARYFGGEISIKSLEGYGVDAYLYLPILGIACENLPQRVVTSPGNLDSSPTDPNQMLDGDGYYDGMGYDEYWTDGYSRNDDFFQDTAITKRSSVVSSILNERAL